MYEPRAPMLERDCLVDHFLISGDATGSVRRGRISYQSYVLPLPLPILHWSVWIAHGKHLVS